MQGNVPELAWYLLAVGFVVFAVILPIWLGIWTGHRVQMRALQLLKTYAEKGEEPPAAVLEAAFRGSPAGTLPARPRAGRADQMERFVWAAACAASAAGVAWWRSAAGGPAWVVYAAVIAAAVLAVGALARLVAAIFSPTTDER
jgi:hypothetical protein